MLTLFSIPKAFHGHIGIIQTNAIQSWALLRPTCEVILFGDEEGTAETAARFGIRHVPEVERNEYRTPLLNSLFDNAQQIASHRLLCYVNADIILMSDFLMAVERVKKWLFLFLGRPFLLVGRRWDVAVDEAWDFTKVDWQDMLRARIATSGILRSDWAIDYFVFSRGLWGKIPPFAIGRTAWDNWLIYAARLRGAPVIDVTKVVSAVHQNHDYAHHPGGETGVFTGPESVRNRELGGKLSNFFSTLDATWILTETGLWPAWTHVRLWRRMQRTPGLFRECLRSRLRPGILSQELPE